jgi:hypothetical protein
VQPLQPGSAAWAEAVREAISLDAGRNWFLGDIALKIAPMGTNRANNGGWANLRLFADETGIEYESLRAYRSVAFRWPQGMRLPSACWSVHQVLIGHRELIRPGLTVTLAREALGQSLVGRTGPQSSVEDRAEAVREYLADPEVAEAVRAAIPAPRRQQPESTAFDSFIDMRASLAKVRDAISELGQVATRRGAITARDREWAIQRIEECREALAMVIEVCQGGDMDAALASLLRDEGGER